MKDKKMLIYIVVIIIAAATILGVFFLGKKTNQKDDKNKQVNTPYVEPTEKDLIDEFGYTKEKAIEKIKTIYTGDKYQYTCDIKNGMYIVTVTNEDTKTTTKWRVDPSTGQQLLLSDKE